MHRFPRDLIGRFNPLDISARLSHEERMTIESRFTSLDEAERAILIGALMQWSKGSRAMTDMLDLLWTLEMERSLPSTRIPPVR